jgi:hypothetical protein
MFHSHNDIFVEKSHALRSKLVTSCLRRKMLQEVKTARKNVSSNQTPWEEWVSGEAKLRAGYCIWVGQDQR